MRQIFSLFIILSAFLSLNTLAQTPQQQKVDAMYRQIKQQFNARQPDSIYALAGSELKNELDIQTFRTVCNNNLFPLGQIIGETLTSFQNDKIATYKLKLSTNTPIQLLMSLDDAGKLQLFLFQPIKQPRPDKNALVPANNKLLTQTDKKVDSAARTYIQKANTVGMVIGVYKGGKISTYGYGETAKGSGKIPSADNVFELGSITKTFTSILLAYYAGEGKFKLDDPITRFLPDSVAANPALKGITLLNLSNHTSGLPRLPEDFFTHVTDRLNPYKGYGQKLLFAYLKNCKPATKPGDRYIYSTLGVGVLGYILEKVSGKSYEQMLTEVITRPLGMNSTVVQLTPLLKQRFVSTYNEDGDPTPAWDFSVLAPGGALRSSLNNMMLYVKANIISGPAKLSNAIILTHRITYNQNPKVGMAWHIIVVNGVDYYFHDGGTGGSSTAMAFNIERTTGVVILANSAENTVSVLVDILKKLQ